MTDVAMLWRQAKPIRHLYPITFDNGMVISLTECSCIHCDATPPIENVRGYLIKHPQHVLGHTFLYCQSCNTYSVFSDAYEAKLFSIIYSQKSGNTWSELGHYKLPLRNWPASMWMQIKRWFSQRDKVSGVSA